MSTPNPGTTPWVPMWNLNGGMDLRYQGAWAAGNYYDGDVVVYQGVTYICVRPTNKAPTPWAPGNLVVSPSVRVFRSTVQSVPSSTWTSISWDTVRYDRGPAAHWNINNPTRLTCQVAGTYAISGHVTFNNIAGGTYRIIDLHINGTRYTAINGMSGGVAITAASPPYISIPEIVYLNVGDYIELRAYQDSGSSLNINAGDNAGTEYSCDLSMALIGGMQGPPGLAANVNYGTTLPPTPADGQEAILVDSTTNPTYQWRFRYNAGHTGDGYKWECTGGTHAFTAGSTTAQPTNATWIDAGGPSMTLPRDGVYDIEWGCAYAYIGTDNAYSVCMGIKTPSLTNPSTPWYVNSGVPAPATHRWTMGTVAGLCKAQYNIPGATGTSNVVQPWMAVRPIRVA